MITKEEIRSIPELHKSIQRDKKHLWFLREKSTAVPSGLSDHERVQISPSNDQMHYVEEAVDLNREIEAKEAKLLELQTSAKEFIESLPHTTETEKLTVRVLRLRYLKCYTWESIGDLVGYVQRWPQQLEADALKKLEK